MAARWPRTRTIGGAPAVMCRSDARRGTTSISRSAKSKFIACAIGRGTPDLEPPRTESSGRLGARRGDARDLGDRGAALADLLQAVGAQPAHALLDRDVGDAVRRRALDRQRPDLLGHR